MDADLKKMKKLAKMMRNEGILVYKTPQIELQLAPSAMFYVEQSKAEESTAPIPESPQYTEEEILLWSAPGLSETGAA